MALYVAVVTDFSTFSYMGIAGTASVEDILAAAYPGIFVPNTGYSLKIFSDNTDLISPVDGTTVLVNITSEFATQAPKNSINSGQYVLRGGEPAILFEVG